MITAIDTNILLDILIPNTSFLQRSLQLLETAFAEGTLILSEAVYAELASQFDDHAPLRAFLTDNRIQLLSSSPEVLFLASQSWSSYHARRSDGLLCANCGHKSPHPSCPNCHQTISVRQHIISDFLIGAHAQILANRLLTRDRGFYRTYFSDLVLLSK